MKSLRISSPPGNTTAHDPRLKTVAVALKTRKIPTVRDMLVTITQPRVREKKNSGREVQAFRSVHVGTIGGSSLGATPRG